MLYYHVWVRSEQYRANEPLTYKYSEQLAPGKLVRVPLRKVQVVGVITAHVNKPSFPTKPISEVFNLPPLPKELLQLAVWLQQFYPSPIGVISQQFLPVAIQPTTTKQVNTHSIETVPPHIPPLTAEQQEALTVINHPDTFTLHGRTGSGKTRLYIEVAKQTLASGRSVLVLSPEIGLASQLAAVFRHSFGSAVIVFHSQLTSRERHAAWHAILTSNKPLVVIGPRSSLFTPLRNIGLLVIDESHDQAYKQEQPPYYQASRVAAQLRELHNAILILGSATPAVAEYYLALHRGKPIIRLTELATSRPMDRTIIVVDLKNREQFTRTRHLSDILVEAISQSLAHHEQTILYLNRRGTARLTMCDTCGWQALCPNCDIPLTFHGDHFSLRCHICGYQHAPITSCPVCGNADIVLKSFGTKAIADEISRLFPEARILRFDTDNAKAERLEHHYETIADGAVDILIGTQVLAKGLDLPHLSTLGILLADTSLYLPDYTAQERTYQLLNQVLGRIGRGHIAGTAIIQSYNPGSKLLQAAIDDGWAEFYSSEIRERKKYFFPPFCHMLKLSCRRASAKNAEKATAKFKAELEALKLPITIEGPAPAFHEKTGGAYRWQLVIKSVDRSQLLRVIRELPAGWSYDLDPADLL